MPKVVDHEQRRIEVGEALLRVMARDGIDQVSIRSVAAEAGWSRGVVEHYFANRDDLLLFAYRLSLQREAGIVFRSTTKEPLDRLVGLLLRALPVDEVSALDFRNFLGLVGRLADRPELAAALSEDHRDYETLILSSVRVAMDAGHLRSDLQAESVAYLLSTFVDGLGIWSALHPDESTLSALEEKVRGFIDTLTPHPTLQSSQSSV